MVTSLSPDSKPCPKSLKAKFKKSNSAGCHFVMVQIEECKCPGGHREEGHGVVHHVQGEHHQTYLLHHYQNASIQGRQIQCRMDQM